MKPSAPLLWSLVIWIIVGIVESLGITTLPIWTFFGASLLGLIVADGILMLTRQPVTLSRRIPGRMALGIADDIEISVKNTGSTSVKLKIHDGVPPTGDAPEMPWQGVIPAKSARQIKYRLRMLERGRWVLEPAHVESRSLMGFWLRSKRIGNAEILKVYPNYEPALRYALLALANQQSQMGIRPRNLMGMSKEFLQLRDYQEGDVLSQIDWKATSRHLSLISREYQEHKDQSLILMLDTGRRMRAMDGELSHFDHCLNAVLLVAYLALKNGDQISILGFGGSEKWLPPLKGEAAMPQVLDHLYDYQTTTQPSDFSAAAERLMAHQKRRAMVVIVSNLRGEDEGDLIPAIEILRSRHLVIVTSLKEQSVSQTMSEPVSDFDEAVHYGAAANYLEERNSFLKVLRSRGVTVVDTAASELPIAISNAYLETRKST